MAVLLAFDTATPHVTVALHDGTSVVATFESEESMRHGEMLAPGIERVLADAGASATDLTGIAVGVGPGPFTGLRVGLVTARTLAFARGIPVHGVCSLDVLAADAIDAGLDDFAVATDARRKEVYVARTPVGDGSTARRSSSRSTRPPSDRSWVGERCSTPSTSRTPWVLSTPRRPCCARSWPSAGSRSSTPSRSTCAAPTLRSRASPSGSARARERT